MVSLPFLGPTKRRTTTAHSSSTSPDATSSPPGVSLTKEQLKLATKTRKTFAVLSSFFLFIAVIFLILVEIGNISNRAVLKNTFFIKLDLSNIVPASVPNAVLLNTIAQTLGLHDFYQVGLWNFCEGYNGQGISFCSSPKSMYWFNPVEILRDELIAGASINLPSDVTNILDLIKRVSNIMFGLFLTGTCLSTVLIVITPISLFTRWLSLFVGLLTFLNALFITVGSVIATVMFVIFRNTITSFTDLNLGAEVGAQMFGFMWTASAFAIFSWLIQMGLCCCCASRRDVKTGRKKGNAKAYAKPAMAEKTA